MIADTDAIVGLLAWADQDARGAVVAAIGVPGDVDRCDDVTDDLDPALEA